MFLELARLSLGLLIAAFHRRIADYVLVHEQQLVARLRQTGIALPPAPSTETMRNIYYGIGISTALIQILRIWTLIPAW